MSNLDHTLLQIYRLLIEAVEVYALLPKILDIVIRDTNAERGQIELYDEQGKLRFLKARKNGGDIEDRRESKISSMILAWVKETNEIVLSADATKDARFRDSATVLGQNVLSVVCAPLRDEQGTFGVLYIDNRLREALFTEATKDLLGELASRLAVPLRKRIEQQEEQKRISRELQHARDRELGYLEMIGNSPAMQKVFEEIEFLATHEDNVLILGESGTGKELVARLAHRKSKRSAKPFVAFDCSTVPEDILISTLFGHERGAFTGAVQRRRGLVEEAEGGTLFLDEVGNLTPRVQTMLLGFLDHKVYRPLGLGVEKDADVRLMFATNDNLAELVQQKRFREDLYFRLKKGVIIRMPPLRERGTDVLLLADFFLEKFNKDYKSKVGLGSEAGGILLHYAHPGNVRDLEAIVREAARAALKARQELILPHHLPEEVLNGFGARRAALSPTSLRLSSDDAYAQYLPKEFQDRHFIWGCLSEQSNGKSHELHEQLLIAINPVPGMPLKFATRAVAHAFERNVLLALLRQTQGKQNEAIKLARIDKSAFINKMKRHGINLKKNYFEKGEQE